MFTYSAICDVPEETLLFAVKGTWRANLLFYISMQSPGLADLAARTSAGISV